MINARATSRAAAKVAKAIAIATAALLSLSACANSPAEPLPPAPQAAAQRLLEIYALDDKPVREVIDTLDQAPWQRPLKIAASVRSAEVLLGDSTTEAALPITDDEFYVSIAPYLTRTHDCYFHNLGTCQGELANTAVQVKITADDGTVLIDEAATTYANGFVGFWLPRDISGTIEIESNGKSGAVPFATAEDSATCLTTLQLS